MYFILYNFQRLPSQHMGHETDIKRNLKWMWLVKKSKKTSKSISTHPVLRYAHSRVWPVPIADFGLPPTAIIPARMLDKHRAPVAPRTPDFRNRDVCCHHTESNALPTELRDRLSLLSFVRATGWSLLSVYWGLKFLVLWRHLDCVFNSTVLVLRRTIYGGQLLLVIVLVIATC